MGSTVKARSVVFDLFGDYLRYRGGQVRLRALVALMACLDVPEPTARVVAARLRKEGWLDSRRDGRETTYALTDRAWQLLDEGRSRIFDRAGGPWDGQWRMVIYQVPETERALRERLRQRLAWLGFGALAPSVWVSPHDRAARLGAGSGIGLHDGPGPGPETDGTGLGAAPDPALDRALAELPGARLDVFVARSAGAAADRDMAGRAWDLAALDRDYAAWLHTYRPRLARYRRGLDGRSALVERMRLVHDYRMFPFRDPDLPPELLPERWSGRAAHEVFLEAHGLLREPAVAFADEVLATPIRVTT